MDHAEKELIPLAILALAGYLLWVGITDLIVRVQYDNSVVRKEATFLAEHYRTAEWVERDARGVVDGGLAEIPIICACQHEDADACRAGPGASDEGDWTENFFSMTCRDADEADPFLGDAVDVRLIDGAWWRVLGVEILRIPNGYVSEGDNWIEGYSFVEVKAWWRITARMALVLVLAALGVWLIFRSRSSRFAHDGGKH